MKRIAFVCAVLSLFSFSLYAQDEAAAPVALAAPKTLFPYPQVPDTISTLQDRTNYILIHFWENYDLSKPIQDKALFEKTFQDYIDFFKYAHKTVVFNSIKDFMNRAQSNTANLVAIGEMAERNLYAPTAQYWSDEAYLPFIQTIIASKSVKNIEKVRYKAQLAKINNNQLGQIVPDIEFVDVNGEKKKISSLPATEMTFIFINNPDCEDCSIARVRLSTDVVLNKLISDGKLTFVSITPAAYSKQWAEDAKQYADNWIIGACDNADDMLDIRRTPCFILLDKDKKIVNKNISPESIKALINNN